MSMLEALSIAAAIAAVVTAIVAVAEALWLVGRRVRRKRKKR